MKDDLTWLSSAKTTHADMAFLSKLVMHSKQALSKKNSCSVERFSTPFEAIQAWLSACSAQFYVFLSSAYVCALERGKIWEFWGTREFSQWQSLVVAQQVLIWSIPGNGLCRNGAFVCLRFGIILLRELFLSLFLVDKERRLLKWRNCQLDQHATFKGSF